MRTFILGMIILVMNTAAAMSTIFTENYFVLPINLAGMLLAAVLLTKGE